MGFYDYDNPNLYKDRVTDIPVNKLDGVPTNSTGDPTAINQGVAQVRCFIHPYCPFVKHQREEIHLTLNDLTLPVIIENLPEKYKNILTTSFGTEGIHFKEKYVYRHNYLVEELAPGTTTSLSTPYADILGASFPAVAETRYRDEQSWIIRQSVFDEINSFTGCAWKAKWTYQYPNISTAYSYRDELLDYRKDFYLENSKYEHSDNPGINKNDIQMPSQISSYSCNGAGVNWRVEKKTPLFRGEDFFIEFERLSKSPNVGDFFQGGEEFSPQFTDPYGAIDVFNEESKTISLANGEDFILRKNKAVLEGDDPRVTLQGQSISWRLFDQPYYIVELGDGTSSDEHYFIILCERAYPLFIAIREYEGFKYSQRLSLFDSELGGVHGSSLMNAEVFRMTVRNHLGKLVIFFDVDGDRSNNWVVEKTRFREVENEIDNSSSTSHGVAATETVQVNDILTVPNQQISIWGGNMQSGFIFGPLQYRRDSIKFKWQQNIILPINDANSGRLTVTDSYVYDMANFSSTPGRSASSESLFAQGSHFYKEWGKSRKKSIDLKLNKWEQAKFLYREKPLIEQTSHRSVAGAADVLIGLSDPNKIKKNVLTDEDLGKIAFGQYISLYAGSHIFDGESHNNEWKSDLTYQNPTIDNVNDDLWVVDACKTPIMTNIRFVSEEDESPRWEDGTGSSGYDGLPDSSAPYFRDVSHHVLSYSDNWNANDFYEMEHSGTIDFLLKEVAVYVDDTGTASIWNDSSYLRSLQDKAFYIEVWAGYEPLATGLEYTQLGGFYKMFTGVCYGGSLDRMASREIMTCQIHDYKRVLQDQKFFNSPFYDGVRDVDAVKEIFDMAGFRSKGSHDPGSLLRVIQSNTVASSTIYTSVDGRPFRVLHYALPSSYRRIEQPYFKFSAGTSLYDGVIKIAQSASKLFYFDQNGVAHFEDYLDKVQSSLVGTGSLESLFDFTTNHFEFPGQLVYNKLEWQYRMEDVHNHLKITTGTPDLNLISRNDVNLPSLNNPGLSGFLGYKKLFYQREGMLGSEGAVQSLMDFYKVMFLPELFVKFETQGVPLRATDFITVNGQILRVTKISHEIDGEKNIWWMNVEGERMQPPE